MATRKSDNPNNPICSSCLQALLDLQQVGLINQDTIDYVFSHKSELRKADDVYDKRQYPDGRTSFCKLDRDIQLSYFLTGNACKILYALIQNMRVGNLIEMSITDGMLATGLSKNAVNNALQELVDNGCLVVRLKRNKTRGTVYMVNPYLCIVGKADKHSLGNTFWQSAGDRFDASGELILSAAHKAWKAHTDKKTYTRGQDRQELADKTVLYFNKINNVIEQQQIEVSQKNAPVGAGACTDAATYDSIDRVTEGITEDLPF